MNEEYEVIILVSPFLFGGENLTFFFEERDKAYEFMESCLDNQYIVALNKK